MGVLTDFQLDYSFIDEIDSQVSAVIVAAGSAERFNGDKQFAPIMGVPVLARTLSVFDRCSLVRDIVVVGRSRELADIQSLCDKYEISKVTDIVEGGASRFESVVKGINACSPDVAFFAIHDGARPLVTDEIISKAILRAKEVGAAAPAVKLKDTVKRVNVEKKIVETPKRDFLYAVQTPQVFDAKLYKKALEKAKAADVEFTDDCSVMEFAGFDVFLTEGSYENIKITTPDDVFIADAVLERRKLHD